MKKIVSACTLSVLMAPGVGADPYVALGGTYYHAAMSPSFGEALSSKDEESVDTTYFAEIGYLVSDFWGIKLGYVDLDFTSDYAFATAPADDTSTESGSVQILTVGGMRLVDLSPTTFASLGAGVAYLESESKFTQARGSQAQYQGQSRSSNAYNPYLEVGLGYRLTETTEVVLSYGYFGEVGGTSSLTNPTEVSVETTNLGVRLHF
jgi:hypothetical protein